MALSLVNGLPARSVDSGDRGLMYGDGVFRTLVVRAGRALNWARHFRLLAHDCGRLGLPCPAESLLLDEIGRVAPVEAIVKVIVTRGASGRGYACAADFAPTRIVAAHPAPAPEIAEAARVGIRARRCDLALAIQPRLAGVKSLNRLENVLARAEWRDPAIREGLLADSEGRLAEGTASNVFFTSRETLVTPDLSRCGVNGAQRERVLELARAAGIACQVRDAHFGELGEAGEVFLTNSVIGIWPVVALGEWRWAPGPVARRMQRLIEDDDARGA
ncbi:MAG TPA: aminodeoxychorismate lyase [Usitatibacteraceae bacterium]|nr:aminodeoxychorismate lyase [Usitatibacteraceae bacterium]